MAGLATSEEAVIAAERRLASSATEVRAAWQMLRSSSRNMLTGPLMVGSVAVAGALVGRRRKEVPRAMECKCVKESPSFVRVLFVAMLGPLLQGGVARVLNHLTETRWKQADTDAPHRNGNSPVDATSA